MIKTWLMGQVGSVFDPDMSSQHWIKLLIPIG